MDFITDNNPALMRALVLRLPEIPEFAKTAAEVNTDDLAQLPATSFANPFSREYPMNSKANSWYGLVHAMANDAADHIVDNLKTACAKHGVTEQEISDVVNAAEALEHTKRASLQDMDDAPTDFYALDFELSGKDASEAPRRFVKYPINDESQIVHSAEQMSHDYANGKIPPSWFKHACETMHDALIDFGHDPAVETPLPLPEDVRYHLPERMCDKRASVELLKTRKQDAGDRFNEYVEIISHFEDIENGVKNAHETYEPADAMFMLDKELGIKYGAVTPDPLRILYSGPTQDEAAAEVKSAFVRIPVNGDVQNIPLDMLSSNLPLHKIFRGKKLAHIKRALDMTIACQDGEFLTDALRGTPDRNLFEFAKEVAKAATAS